MGFITIPGLAGKVYVPDTDPDGTCRKHPCQDCFSCQNCGDDRCRICRGQGVRIGPISGKVSKDADRI